MHIIKLDAIDSTNSYLRQLSSSQPLKDYTVVMAESQTNGRGQMGTNWSSQSGKNLTVSVFVDVTFLPIELSFYISMAISLAISEALKEFQIKQVKVKWPNDILADQKKISGVLIENVIKNNQLQGSIIGFGLNINQTDFEHLPQATSMRMVSGSVYNRDEVLQCVLKRLQYYIDELKAEHFEELKANYEAELFRKNKPSTFQDAKGHLFSGYIKGVSPSGHLHILVVDGVVKSFDLKDVKLLY